MGDIILVVGNWKLTEACQQKRPRLCGAEYAGRGQRSLSCAQPCAARHFLPSVLMVALMLTDEILNPIAAIIACLLMGKISLY